MTITAIQQGKRDDERVNIFVDGQFALALDKSTLVEAGLYQGKEVTSLELVQILRQDCFQFLYRKGVEIWLRRPHSRRELKQKLQLKLMKRKGAEQFNKEDSNACLEEVLERLAGKGYTDEKFAVWFAQQRAAQGKYGSHRVHKELVSKGVASDVVKATVSQFFTDGDELRKQLLLKKFGVQDLQEIKDLKTKAKAYRYLASRGV